MRARRLAFLIFVFVADISLDVAAIDLSSTPRLKATTLTSNIVPKLHGVADDKRPLAEHGNEERVGGNPDLLVVREAEELASAIRRTESSSTQASLMVIDDKAHGFDKWLEMIHTHTKEQGDWFDPEEVKRLSRSNANKDMLQFSLWLLDRPGDMKSRTHYIQNLICKNNAEATKTLTKMWLERETSPNDVFESVKDWENGLDVWFNYAASYWNLVGTPQKYSLKLALDNYLHFCSFMPKRLYGIYIQEHLESSPSTFAQLLQNALFHHLYKTLKKTPASMSTLLARGHPGILSVIQLGWNSVEFRTFEAYTLYHARGKGYEQKAKSAFDSKNMETISKFVEGIK
ncbi:unnamed protein product [Hyaloperonospora brassicae]|uniref:RxLR effector candidate protein n=1 Tax=Hyaloperonospora brassicae TaxID=162125 RepID=A0AAV0TP05_HYABA|nr:unnamed protein product [Hyaloperonospora brassicae]